MSMVASVTSSTPSSLRSPISKVTSPSPKTALTRAVTSEVHHAVAIDVASECWSDVFYEVVTCFKFVSCVILCECAITDNRGSHQNLWIFRISVLSIFLIAEELELWRVYCAIVRHVE